MAGAAMLIPMMVFFLYLLKLLRCPKLIFESMQRYLGNPGAEIKPEHRTDIILCSAHMAPLPAHRLNTLAYSELLLFLSSSLTTSRLTFIIYSHTVLHLFD